MNNSSPKRILVAPLDWGLGHATRCIPIIRELIRRKAEIFIASSGHALILLRQEFPDLIFFELPAYRMHYSKRLPFSVNLFLQAPKFFKAEKLEHDQITKVVEEHKVDLIISDSRVGCWSNSVPSVFITHQVNLQMPLLLKWLSPAVNRLNHRWINRFTHCWIPDELENPISGKLSSTQSINARFIGILSRFKQLAGIEKKYNLLVLLSGPEPQRTVLEEILLKQLMNFSSNVFFVRGLPGENHLAQHNNRNVSFANHLPSDELNNIIEESELIICRSGYSTVMDMARLAKKVIFIPTPGQTEQEYLAEELMKRKIAFCVNQDSFNLMQALKLSVAYTGFVGLGENDLMEKAFDELGI